MLALGDYIEAMGQTPEERSQTVQECLSSVMQHKEQLDDVLLISIGRNLPAHIRKELMNGAKTPSSVQFIDTAPYPKNQTPSFEKWIMRTFMPQFEATPKELPEIKKAVSLVKRIEEQEFTDQSEAKNSRLSAQLLSNYGQGGR